MLICAAVILCPALFNVDAVASRGALHMEQAAGIGTGSRASLEGSVRTQDSRAARGWGGSTRPETPSNSMPGWPHIAIWSAIVLAVSCSLYKCCCSRHNRVVSQFGEIKTVFLPDHSEVTLNANSRIRYARRWRKGQTREVWLDGEAFFDIRPHGRKAAGFLVHTRGMEVEASGASFNVKDRRDKTAVVLNSGSARLCLKDDPDREAQLGPGEKVVYHLRDHRMLQSLVSTNAWCDWRHNMVVLDEFTVQEIAELLEDNYGIKVAIGDPTVANRKLRGRFVANNLQEVVAVLKNALRVGIDQPEKLAGQ